MANIKSAKKRILVNKRQKAENKFVKATINTSIKKYRALVAENKLTEAEVSLKNTTVLIDSACSKGVLHRNNASRKISRLNILLVKANKGTTNVVEPSKKEKTIKKTVAPVVEAKKEVATTPAKVASVTKATATKAAPAKATTVKKDTAPAVAAKATPAKKETAPKAAPAKTTTVKKETATKAAATKTAATKTAVAAKATPAKKPTTK